MKLFKTYPRGIGNQVISVPTNSDFLIGVKTDNVLSSATLTDLDSQEELSPLDKKIGSYVAFKQSTGNEPFSKEYIATLTGTREGTVPMMGKTFMAWYNSQHAGAFLMDFKLDELSSNSFWDFDNHPASFTGTNAALVIGSDIEHPSIVYKLETPVFSWTRNATHGVVYSSTLRIEGSETSTFDVGIVFIMGQIYDTEQQKLVTAPEGFVPSWDNQPELTIGTQYQRVTTYGIAYQGITQIGEETGQVPFSTDYRIRVDCHKSSLGNIELG